jgi:hypothetical protein
MEKPEKKTEQKNLKIVQTQKMFISKNVQNKKIKLKKVQI